MSDGASSNFFRSLQASVLAAVAVILFLFWLIYIQKPAPNSEIPAWVQFLPTLNALANALSAVFLVRAVIFIKRGRKEAHRRNIWVAVAFSALFLMGYILFHTYHGDRKFIGESLVRGFYLIVLASHIVMSALSLPAILFTLSLGLQSRWESHRRWARWTFPAWLYVNVTGVLVHILFSVFSKS
jgi:putative membrane protein